jgi:hypothetical protein
MTDHDEPTTPDAVDEAIAATEPRPAPIDQHDLITVRVGFGKPEDGRQMVFTFPPDVTPAEFLKGLAIVAGQVAPDVAARQAAHMPKPSPLVIARRLPD